MPRILPFIPLFILVYAIDGSQHLPFRPKRHPVISNEIEQLGGRNNGMIHAWIYFVDKGISEQRVEEALKITRKKLNKRNLLRRKRRGLQSDIVTFRDLPVNPDYIQQVLEIGGVLRQRSRWLNAISIEATRSQLEVISQFPMVAKIDPVLMYSRPRPEEDVINDQLFDFPIPKGSNRTRVDTLDYGSSFGQIHQINCDLAHEAGYTGRGVIVLMIDTGYRKDHESIQEDRIIAEWDFINHDGNTQNEGSDPSNQHNHGTYTFSALGGYAPGHLIGPAFESRFLLAKTEIVNDEIQQEEDNFVAALEWGDSLGADVVSSSVGYIDWYTYSDLDGNTAVTTKAMDIAASLGIVCVTAAGNEGNSDWYYIITPADADSVTSVGAVDSENNIASFSSHGPTYDGRIKPEVCARGVQTVSASALKEDQYTRVNGTSLSTPLVAGAAAVILSAHPDWTPMMVREALMMTASRADYPDNTYGWGVINVWEAIQFNAFTTGPNPSLPEKFFLSQNYPNPFNPFNQSTTITYYLPYTSRFTIKIYNLMGNEIATLVDDLVKAGEYEIKWSAVNYPSGIYFVQLRVLWYLDINRFKIENSLFHRKKSDYTMTRRLVLIK